MLIAKSSLVDLFFFCRQLVSTQLGGGLGVMVPSAWHDPQTGISFPLRCPAVVSVQYVLVLLRLIPCLSMWPQWSFSSFVDEIRLACIKVTDNAGLRRHKPYRTADQYCCWWLVQRCVCRHGSQQRWVDRLASRYHSLDRRLAPLRFAASDRRSD